MPADKTRLNVIKSQSPATCLVYIIHITAFALDRYLLQRLVNAIALDKSHELFALTCL